MSGVVGVYGDFAASSTVNHHPYYGRPYTGILEAHHTEDGPVITTDQMVFRPVSDDWEVIDFYDVNVRDNESFSIKTFDESRAAVQAFASKWKSGDYFSPLAVSKKDKADGTIFGVVHLDHGDAPGEVVLKAIIPKQMANGALRTRAVVKELLAGILFAYVPFLKAEGKEVVSQADKKPYPLTKVSMLSLTPDFHHVLAGLESDPRKTVEWEFFKRKA